MTLARSKLRLIYLHGWPDTVHSSRPFASALAKALQAELVILQIPILDTCDPSISSMDDAEARLAKQLDAQAAQRTVLVAHDLGCKLSYRWACDNQERLQAYIMLDVADNPSSVSGRQAAFLATYQGINLVSYL